MADVVDPATIAVLAQGVDNDAVFTPTTEEDQARAALLQMSVAALSVRPAPAGLIYCEYTGPGDEVGLPDFGTLQPGDVVLLTNDEAYGKTIVSPSGTVTTFPPLDHYAPIPAPLPPAGRRVYITPGHMAAFSGS